MLQSQLKLIADDDCFVVAKREMKRILCKLIKGCTQNESGLLFFFPVSLSPSRVVYVAHALSFKLRVPLRCVDRFNNVEIDRACVYCNGNLLLGD